ncbi:hypothetical protein C8R41DRAFT_861281 [Lentinula lateritia]|uniref:Uncharacterized protein n=1 Tax=Lentinula lateritia TaxID=40482 RepID=A0ABQ8UWM7_9AGAR|nr:hypothetical protein C8R41DRAFT_861281 [Lentinula lateritia]
MTLAVIELLSFYVTVAVVLFFFKKCFHCQTAFRYSFQLPSSCAGCLLVFPQAVITIDSH